MYFLAGMDWDDEWLDNIVNKWSSSPGFHLRQHIFLRFIFVHSFSKGIPREAEERHPSPCEGGSYVILECTEIEFVIIFRP